MTVDRIYAQSYLFCSNKFLTKRFKKIYIECQPLRFVINQVEPGWQSFGLSK